MVIHNQGQITLDRLVMGLPVSMTINDPSISGCEGGMKIWYGGKNPPQNTFARVIPDQNFSTVTHSVCMW